MNIKMYLEILIQFISTHIGLRKNKASFRYTNLLGINSLVLSSTQKAAFYDYSLTKLNDTTQPPSPKCQ